MNLLRLFQKGSFSYSGKDSYKYVDGLLRNEKELLLVSPYVDDYYADYIVAHSGNKKIHLLSSSIKGSAAKKLNSSPLPRAIVFSSILLFINIALFVLGFFHIYILSLSLLLAAVSLASAFIFKRRIRIKIPHGFVHAKMYLGNNYAIEGSANLTYAGMHKNIERINVISDPAKIKEFRRQFWKMWNSS